MSCNRLPQILIMVLGCIAWSSTVTAQPTAVDGLINLSDWNFETGGNVPLKGQYEFYWQRFLNRQELLAENPEFFAEVPKPWNGVNIGNDVVTPHGFATYRLTILIPPDLHRLSLMIPNFGTSGRVIIDGEMKLEVGSPGTQASTTRGSYKPHIVDFEPDGQRVELVLHIANFNHRAGGAWKTLLLGKPDAIHELKDLRIAKQLLLVGALLMIALFNLAFFTLRRDKLANLFIALFCLSAALQIISVGESYLLRLFPDLSWENYARIEYISWYLLVPLFSHFLLSLYPNEVNKRVVYLLDALSLLAVGTVLATPLAISSYTVPPMRLLTLAGLVFGIYCLLLARRDRREGANLLLFGFLLLSGCAINDILALSHFIDSPSIMDVGIVGFAVCQTMLAFADSARSVKIAETQYEQLATSSLKLQTQEKLRVEAELQSRKVSARFRESQQFEALGILAHGVVSDLKESFDQAAKETQALARELESDPKLLASLEKTTQVTDRSVAVIEDLLSLSTFDNAKQATDINRVITEYLDSPKTIETAEQRGVIVERNLTSSVQAVVGSTLHIRRILENLLTNAFDNQIGGGLAVVGTEQVYTDGRTLFFDTIERGYYVMLSVEDKGNGVHPENLDSIFQPFFTRGESTKGAIGLGMSVVRAIVKQLNGGIDVISELGLGSRFDIYLPVSIPDR
jgi:signal transduction histidine kinase